MSKKLSGKHQILPLNRIKNEQPFSSSITVKILKGNFEALSSPQDIFLKLSVPTKTGTKMKRTQCHKGIKSPIWKEEFDFESPDFPIKCQCFARITGSDKNQQLGSFSIENRHVVANMTIKKTFTFTLHSPHTGKGSVDLELEFKEVTRRALGRVTTATNRGKNPNVASPRDS